MCAPMVEAFSITQTEMSGLSCLSRIAKARPGGAGADGDDVVLHHVAFGFSHAVPSARCVAVGSRDFTRASVGPWPCRRSISRARRRARSALAGRGRGDAPCSTRLRGKSRGNPPHPRVRPRVRSAAAELLDRRSGRGLRYSGARFEPHPWPAALRRVRERLARELDGAVQQRAGQPVSRWPRRTGLASRFANRNWGCAGDRVA